MKAFDRLSDKRNFPHPASTFQPINPDFSSGSRYFRIAHCPVRLNGMVALFNSLLFFNTVLPENKNPLLCRNGFFIIVRKCKDHTLISTSTPEGSSNFIRASTVLEEEE